MQVPNLKVRGKTQIRKITIGRPISKVNPFLSNIDFITGIDTSTKQDGSVLVYNDVTNLWEATTLLNEQNIDGGTY